MATSQLIVKAATSTGIRIIEYDSATSPSLPRATLVYQTGPMEVAVQTQVTTKDEGEHHGTFSVLSFTVSF
jgi:hypothetical protein